MAQYSFGVGNITLVPPATATDQTPRQVGILRDVSLEVSKTTKELKGAKMFAVDIAVAGGKVSGKAKYAQISGGLIASILTGSVTSAGTVKAVFQDPHDAAATVTITPPNSGVFVADFGVLNASYVPMKVNTGTPAVDEYKQTAGVYTFNASQTGKVYISFSYSLAAVGKTIDYDNQLMGNSTVYQMTLFNEFRGKSFGVKLYAVTIPKLAIAFKNEDYSEQDLDFEAFADATENVLTFYTEE